MAVAQTAMLIGVLFGLLPAMAMLYFMLDRYEGFFEDKRIFKFLIIGMVVGGAVTMFETFLRFHEPAILVTVPWSVGVLVLGVGYPAIESVSKLAVLNWPSVVRRKDVPFYAVPVGLGFGAVYTFILLARGIVFQVESGQLAGVTHLQLVLLYVPVVELFVGGIFVHALTATVIGRATMEGRPYNGFASATLLSAPFYLAYYAVYALNATWTLILPTFVLIYGFMGTRWAVREILDHVVPADVARKVRRDLRKKRLGLE